MKESFFTSEYFETVLTKDCFREALMNIIEVYYQKGQLFVKQEETFKGLLHLEGELNVENQMLFCKDVNHSLNLCVGLLKEINEQLTEDEKDEVNDICEKLIQADTIEKGNFKVGELVVYEGLAYQIAEIDTNDFTICLDDNSNELKSGVLDVNPTDIYNPHKDIDYIEHIQPMIDDLKDGEVEPLTENDIDGLMNVIRCKIEFKEGLITEEEYTTLLHSAYD